MIPPDSARAAEREGPTPDVLRLRCLECGEWSAFTVLELRLYTGTFVDMPICGHRNIVGLLRRFAADQMATNRESERLRAEVAAAREDTRRLEAERDRARDIIGNALYHLNRGTYQGNSDARDALRAARSPATPADTPEKP